MKHALILHGTDSNPELGWFKWLKGKLEVQGYEVWLPLLPDNHTPDCHIYNDFLLDSDFDLTDGIVVGHSSGAVEVLNLLMDERCPHIRLSVMVSAWPKGNPVGTWDEGQFDNLFPPDGFHPDRIKSKADKLAFVHSEDDPYCPIVQTKELADELGAPMTDVPNGGHLGDNVSELSQVWDIIEPNL